MPEATETKDMRPHFEEIQAHYDLSDDFFGVFQDPTRKYSCAYFTKPDATLSEAQIANVDQHLEALDLKPGMTCLLYTSPSPRDGLLSRMPSSA